MPHSPAASILIVEDDRSWQDLYRDILEDRYKLTLAETLQQAEAELVSSEFDLAIVDPGLDPYDDSNLDGIKVIKRISILDLPIPVIVITANKARLERDDPSLNAFTDDVIDVIEKSASITEITKAVRKAIEARTRESVEAVLRKKRAQNRWRYLSRRAPGVTGYEAFKRTLHQVLRRTGADVAHLLVPTEDGDELEIIVDTGQDEGRTVRINNSVTGRACRKQEIINLGDVSLDPEYQPVKGPQRMSSELAVPVQSNGEIVSVLNIESHRFHAFDNWHQELMQTFADLAVLMAQSERRQNELEQLGLIARELLESVLDLDKVWKSILGHGLHLIDAKTGFLATRVSDEQIRIQAATEDYLMGQIRDIDNSMTGLAVESGRPQRIDDVRTDDRISSFRDSLDPTALSVLAIPLQLGETVGVLNFQSDRPYAFTGENEKLIVFLANYASLAARMAQQTHQLCALEGQQQQSALAAKLVHSVGNPIRNMRDWLSDIEKADMIKLEHQLPDVAWAISEIGENINQLMKVVRNLKGALQKAALQPKPTDVNACIKSALDEIRSSGKDTGIQIDTQLAPDLPMAFADDGLKDVFIELFQNSIDAMPSGGEMRVVTELGGGKIRAWVEDTGIGVAPRVIPHMFDPGFSKKQGAIEANGLGLSWCKQYIESCGGSIEPKSAPGKGTTMTIVLPMYAEKPKGVTFL